MKVIFRYSWLIILTLLVIHGVSVIRNEWRIKSIYTQGEIVEVMIEKLNCVQKIMSFRFDNELFHKTIDARTCVLYNEGQKIKLKHSQQYPDAFLFVNEQNLNRFILGGLEIALGIIGLLANWPLVKTKRSMLKNFPRLSDN